MPDTNYTKWDVHEYSNLLEECTNHTIRQVTDRLGDHCYQLIDPCGDATGDPWYFWDDVVADTIDAIVDYQDKARFRTVGDA